MENYSVYYEENMFLPSRQHQIRKFPQYMQHIGTKEIQSQKDIKCKQVTSPLVVQGPIHSLHPYACSRDCRKSELVSESNFKIKKYTYISFGNCRRSPMPRWVTIKPRQECEHWSAKRCHGPRQSRT